MISLQDLRSNASGAVARRKPALLAVVLSSAMSAVAFAQSPSAPAPQAGALPSPVSLEQGKPLDRTLSAGELHRYQIKLEATQCAAIEVEQRGIDVVVQVHDDNNALLLEVDDETGRRGTEKIGIVAEQPASYTVSVKAKWKTLTGDYQIRLAQVSDPSDRDRTLYKVQQLRTQARSLSSNTQKRKDALAILQQALALAQQGLGPDDLYVGLVTRELAATNAYLTRYKEARDLFERAIELMSANLGSEHALVSLARSRLAQVYENLENHAKAEELLTQAMESGEKTLGKDDPEMVPTFESLAMLHADRGDYAAAEREFQGGMRTLEAAGLTGNRTYHTLLNNIGVLYIMEKKYDEARGYLLRELEYSERQSGPDSMAVAIPLENLAAISKASNDLASAEKYYLRVLAIAEKNYGRDHPYYASVLMNLAGVDSLQGNYQQQLEKGLRALSILEKRWSSNGSRQTALDGIANAYTALGDFENANKYEALFQSLVETDIQLNLSLGSDREKLAYVSNRYVRNWTHLPISLNLQLEPGNAQAAELGATVLLQRKGRVLDAAADTLGALRKHSSPEDQALLDQLKEATAQFARVSLQGPQQLSAEAYSNQLRDLQQKKEKLENQIGRRNEAFRAQYQPVTAAAVVALIPEDCALVEFAVFRPADFKARTEDDALGEPRYAAYVLHRNAVPQGVDLGQAKSIDALVEKFRGALREPDRSDVQQLGRELAEKVFRPIQDLVANDKRLLISPDGQLDLVPFEALLDSQNRYLIERFPITYLTSGRDLLRMQELHPSQNPPVIIADPLFGEPAGIQMANNLRTRAKTVRRSVTTGTSFSSLYFAPLAGTRHEARGIAALFPQARVLTGPEASKAALDRLQSPRILHIATHGFFLQNAQSSAGANGSASPSNSATENPLLRSGLALSGANLVKDGKREGILTALEASNLNLWGTKLVTLSACDTGVGEVENGEGIYGLRRSFVLAGAETLVMSLWPVSDYVTREMITDYYTGLKHGMGRGDALRQAELTMMKRKGRQHPFYWASFIQSGEWANLEGKR
jgi:CHAT domain-containing protein